MLFFSSVFACLELLLHRSDRFSLVVDKCGSIKPDHVLDASSSEHSAKLSIPTIAKQSDPSNVVRVAIPALKTLSSGKLFGSAASADCMNQRQPNALTIAIHQPRWLGSYTSNFPWPTSIRPSAAETKNKIDPKRFGSTASNSQLFSLD